MCKCLFGIFSKTFLIILNVIFALGGAFLLVIGAIGHADTRLILNFLQIIPPVRDFIIQMETNGTIDLISNMAIGLMTIGGVLFVLGFAGCCGASCSCTLCLVPYAIVLIILIAAQVGLIVFAALDPTMFRERVETTLLKDMSFYNGTGLNFKEKTDGSGHTLTYGDSSWTFSWDTMQIGAECCGSTGHEDWLRNGTNWVRNQYVVCTDSGCRSVGAAVVPLSCCRVEKRTDYIGEDLQDLKFLDAEKCLQDARAEFTNHKGCYEAVEDAIQQYSLIVMAVTGSIMFIQILAVICACFLSRAK